MKKVKKGQNLIRINEIEISGLLVCQATANKIGVFYKHIIKTEEIMLFVAGVIFIVSGIYYVLIFTEIPNS